MNLAVALPADFMTPPIAHSHLPQPALNFKAPLPESAPQSQTTNDVLHTVLRARKNWKYRGGEPIWPLDLEAALLEGLDQYRPEDCRETRILGRFPRRNRFISDYIFDKTGEKRSPKQVGSRLQQLRDTCRDTWLHQLLFPFREPSPYSASPVSAKSSPGSVIPPLEESFLPNIPFVRNTIIYIDILPEISPVGAVGGGTSSPSSDVGDGDVIHAADHPRHLKSISPTVSFTAPSPLIAHSRFTVRDEGVILHAEIVPLVLVVNQAPQSAAFLYSTQLVPNYWNVIVDSPDTTRFTISQEVIQTESSCLLYLATYKFSYPRRSETFSSLPSASWDAPLELPAEDTTGTRRNHALLLPEARCPTYETASRSTRRFRRQNNAPTQTYANQNVTSSSLSLPADLSNYVTSFASLDPFPVSSTSQIA